MQLYSGLELIVENYSFKGRTLDSTEQENQVSVALGQLVQVALHMNQCLGLPLKYPMVFNSHRSSIIEPE